MDEKILLRPATEEDALFVAMVVAEALDDDIMEQYEKAGNQIPESQRDRIKMIESVVRHPDTLYTWRHVTVATKSDGTLVGAIVAYAGDDYAQRRDVTFDMLSALIKGSFDPEKMDPETQAGELGCEAPLLGTRLPRHAHLLPVRAPILANGERIGGKP